jgi:hypothetical protein
MGAFCSLKSLYPIGAFLCDPSLPAIVLKHQLYSMLDDRTCVDREVVSVRGGGAVDREVVSVGVWIGRW